MAASEAAGQTVYELHTLNLPSRAADQRHKSSNCCQQLCLTITFATHLPPCIKRCHLVSQAAWDCLPQCLFAVLFLAGAYQQPDINL